MKLLHGVEEVEVAKQEVEGIGEVLGQPVELGEEGEGRIMKKELPIRRMHAYERSKTRYSRTCLGRSPVLGDRNPRHELFLQ